LVSLMLRASLTSLGRFMVPLVKLASAMIPIKPIKAISLDLSVASIITIIKIKPINIDAAN
jgi:hypothetical protein